MPMPHRTQQQLIKRRLVGKDGAERIRELRSILAELPGYRNGPYADLRKWVEGELDATRTRKRVVHRDSIAVRREGAAQIALVGPPNAGEVVAPAGAVGDPDPHRRLPVHHDAAGRGDHAPRRRAPSSWIPGLIEGAAEDRGGGRALLGVLRNADAILWCHACDRPVEELETIREEVAAAGIDLPAVLAATKSDEAPAPSHPELSVLPVSVLDDESLDRLRAELWALTGLMRVYLRDGGDPIALRPPATVLDVAEAIHHALVERCTGARVWGPSARFGGQRVGRHHELQDGDTVEVLDR
jgi:ribosome-interacting GTPase 1